jgi:hypothetical protein
MKLTLKEKQVLYKDKSESQIRLIDSQWRDLPMIERKRRMRLLMILEDVSDADVLKSIQKLTREIYYSITDHNQE